MEVSSTNPLNIQLATFARNLEWKLQKQNEEKQSELSKQKELCLTKERPLSISSLYYSGPAVSSTCNDCHPNCTSIFQKSFNVLSLKDLLHRPCIPSMKEVKPCQEATESLHPLNYYFMKNVTWFLYHVFRYKYRGILIHPEHIQCLNQAQETGSSILYFLPNPNLTNLCSIYFTLYHSGLRPPFIGFDNIPWYSRWLFSMMGLNKYAKLDFTHSLVSDSVVHFYSDYVNYIIDDIYIVPVSVSTSDRFIHVNLSTPYALSELEIKYSSAELVDENDVDDVRDIDAHIRTDCNRNEPITALAFVAYIIVGCRDQNRISEESLLQGVERIRGEFIREKVGMNFKGTNDHIVKYSLQLLRPYLNRRINNNGKLEFVIKDLNQIAQHAMNIINRKLLLCILTSVVYSLTGSVNFVSGRLSFPSLSKEKTSCSDENAADLLLPPSETNEENNQSSHSVSSGQSCQIKHRELVAETKQRVVLYETRLNIKLFKFCQNPEDEINKTIGDLSDCQILSSTDKGQLVEEKWSANIARELEMGNNTDDDEERNILDTRTYYVEPYDKHLIARTYLNVVQSLNNE